MADDTTAVDPNLALFATYMRESEQKERSDKRAARDARAQADQVQTLVAAKDAAAAEVKRLRGREGVSVEERAAADVAYREALAAVVAAETGEAPAWAPPAPPEPEPTAEGETAGPDDGADQAAPEGDDSAAEPSADATDATVDEAAEAPAEDETPADA